MPGWKGLGKLACELGVNPQVAYVAFEPATRQTATGTRRSPFDLDLVPPSINQWLLFFLFRYRSRGGPLRVTVQCICAERRECIGRRALVAHWRTVDLRRKPVRARLSQVTGQAAELEPEIWLRRCATQSN